MKAQTKKRLTMASFSASDVDQKTKLFLIAGVLLIVGSLFASRYALQTARAAADSQALAREVRALSEPILESTPERRVEKALNVPARLMVAGALEAVAKSAGSMFVPDALKVPAANTYGAARTLSQQLAALPAPPALATPEQMAEIAQSAGKAANAARALQVYLDGQEADFRAWAAAAGLLAVGLALCVVAIRALMKEFEDRFNVAVRQFRAEEAAINALAELLESRVDNPRLWEVAHDDLVESSHQSRRLADILSRTFNGLNEVASLSLSNQASTLSALAVTEEQSALLKRGAESGLEAVKAGQQSADSATQLATVLHTDCQALLTSSQEIQTRAGEASVGVQETASRIEAMRQGLADASKHVKQLGENGQALGLLGETLGVVAEQIEVLAINASLEAERAGDDGVGFAVIARELKAAEERVRDVFERMRGLVGEAQAEVRVATEAVDVSLGHLVYGGSTAAVASTVISVIEPLASQLLAVSKSLANRSAGQVQELKEVSLGSERAAQALERVSSMSGTVAGSSSEASKHAHAAKTNLQAISTVWA